jgi:serine/threonine protein kinase
LRTLSPQRWREVSPYLDQVLSLPETERNAWLEFFQNQNPELADLLRDLLQEHRHLAQRGFLEQSPIGDALEGSRRGQQIGVYTLISPCGQGGMGTVWLAQRNDGRFERQVAIKFLRLSVASNEGAERFKREGRILGQLTHPHIAELLDAGLTANGEPYLVLENVAGEHIDRYCEGHKLDVNACIKLFIDVLQAVEHAHANLVVHRDLKPSNVLVTHDGKVKLLDFGIAKLLSDGPNSALTTAFTTEGGGVLTPLFAAPEQVTAGTVTTATDVYALGVLLYILLTGKHPAGPEPSSPAALLKAIVETVPQRASQAIATAEPAAADLHGTTIEKLRRQLRGDLDTIIAKALKKDPKERYSSATAFADDLQRYLNHQPISARPDTLIYRAGKFLRRRRLPVAAVLLLIAGLATGLYEVNRERIISQRRFSDVRQLANKLFDIDAQVRDLPGSTKARQLIVDTSLEYLQRLTANVHGDPELALDVGNAYMRVARVQGIPIGPTLGQTQQAVKNLKTADSFIQLVLKKEPANRIAMLRAAQIAHDQMILARFAHKDEEAHVLAVKSAEWLGKFHAGKGDETEATGLLNTYLNLADQFRSEGDDEKALQLCLRGADIATTLNRSASRGNFLWVSANVLQTRGDLDEALTTIQESVRLLDPGPDWKTKTGQTLNFYHALTYEGKILGEDNGVSLGRPEAAVYPLRQALDGEDAIVHQDPSDHSSRGDLAMSSITMGGILRHSDAKQALDVYDHALHHLAEVQGDTHLQRYEVNLLAGSSYALRELGHPKEAQQRLETAFKQLNELKLYPTDKIDLSSEAAETLSALADLEVANGNLPEAIKIYEELLNKMDPDESDPQFALEDAVHVSSICESAANAYRRAHRMDRASAMERRRLDLWRRWEQKLPNNPFVRQQREAATHS